MVASLSPSSSKSMPLAITEFHVKLCEVSTCPTVGWVCKKTQCPTVGWFCKKTQCPTVGWGCKKTQCPTVDKLLKIIINTFYFFQIKP